MFWLIGLFVTTVLSYFLYKQTDRYNISEDSKIILFHLIFPFSEKHMKLVYIVCSNMLFGVFFYVMELNLVNLAVFILILFMQMIIFIDIKCFRLPNIYVLPLILLSLIVSSFHIGIMDAFLGGVIAFIIVFIIGMLRVGGLGGGDLKFAVALGMLLGMKYIVVALCLMFILGGLFSFLFYFNKIIDRKDYIPYGPFLFLGYVASFLWFYS